MTALQISRYDIYSVIRHRWEVSRTGYSIKMKENGCSTLHYLLRHVVYIFSVIFIYLLRYLFFDNSIFLSTFIFIMKLLL